MPSMTLCQTFLDSSNPFDLIQKSLKSPLSCDMYISIRVTEKFEETTKKSRQVVNKLKIRDGIE